MKVVLKGSGHRHGVLSVVRWVAGDEEAYWEWEVQTKQMQ